MKTIVSLLLLVFSLWAIDVSDRSTQELLASLMHAKGAQAEAILHELEKRRPMMSEKEKKAYQEALEKLAHGQ
ncbi:hypothetical protein [Hydrogenimonas sp.]